MNDLLKNFVKEIADIKGAERAYAEEIALGKESFVVFGPTGQVIHEHMPKAAPPGVTSRVFDLASTIEWCAKVAQDVGIITVGRTSETVAVSGPIHGTARASWEDAAPVHTARKAFDGRFLPPRQASPQEWLEWWDKVAHGVDEKAQEKVNAAVTSLSAVTGKEVTVAMSGAYLSVQVNAANNVKSAANLPKRFVAEIPFGDPDFRAQVCFVLRVQVEREQISIMTAVDEHFEGLDPYGKYAAWACEQLADLREAGWTILRGA